MAKRALILTSTSNQGKKLQKTITDINPNAGAVALKSFAQKLNAMTTNTYVQTDCIDKFNVDTEIPPVDTRQEPTFSVTWNFPHEQGSSHYSTYTTNSDGEISIGISGIDNLDVGFRTLSGTRGFDSYAFSDLTTGTPFKVTVRIEGTDTFKPFEQTYDVAI